MLHESAERRRSPTAAHLERHVPTFDPGIALAGLGVGFTVGLTGMGGGALLTPIMILFFRVSPLAAVSSDLVVSLLMKPVGGVVHARRGTVHTTLVKWLVVGSVPAALLGAWLLSAMGSENVEPLLRRALGIALLASAGSMILKARLARRRLDGDDLGPVVVRPALTVAIGVAGGLLVGLTSVGSGSLMIVLLLFAYPGLKPAQLVGTDLVQAVPLVGAAALGHLLWGSVSLAITASLLVGALPGVYAGARVSSRAPDRVVRPALITVLLASGLKLVQVV